MKRFALAAVLFCAGRVFAAEKTITVAADGTGDFKTVQEAVVAVPDRSATRTVIAIKPGDYRGPFVVPRGKDKLTFRGDDAKTTRLIWDRNVRQPIPAGSDKFNPGLQVLADDFCAQNLTIENTAGDWGQALAARFDADRVVVEGCRLIGWQDTLMINNGRSYFRDCAIEGRVDFIYGSGTGVFERCRIKSKNGGYVTAASTPKDHPFGFVFLDCELVGDPTPFDPATTNPATTQQIRPGNTAYLGRPWRPFGAAAFLRCSLGGHISPAGWHNWGKASNEQTARYAEYRNTGPGAATGQRAPWARQLTDEEAKAYTVENVLRGDDGWTPAAR